MRDNLLEIVLSVAALREAGFEGRDELEEPLHDALLEAGLGEVTGGGSGAGVAIIDVELAAADSLGEALVVVRRTLRSLGAPADTRLRWRGPDPVDYML